MVESIKEKDSLKIVVSSPFKKPPDIESRTHLVF